MNKKKQTRTREQKRQQRRELILDTVATLLEQNKGFTFNEVSRQVGISRVTLYQYFSSKQELLECVSSERDVVVGELGLPDAKTRILEAARKVFGKDGLRVATMESIAQEAGVGAVTVYRHFGDKAGLIKAFANTVRPHQALNALELSHETSLEEVLTNFATEAIRYLSNNKDLMRILIAGAEDMPEALASMRQRPGRTKDRLKKFLEKSQKAGAIDSQIDPEYLALSFLGMVFSFGVLAPWAAPEASITPEESGKNITRIFLQGTTLKRPESS